jgi:alkylhydroperoxidase family enzyme
MIAHGNSLRAEGVDDEAFADIERLSRDLALPPAEEALLRAMTDFQTAGRRGMDAATIERLRAAGLSPSALVEAVETLNLANDLNAIRAAFGLDPA